MKAPAKRGRRFEAQQEDAWGEVLADTKRLGRSHEPDLIAGEADGAGIDGWVVECKNEQGGSVSTRAIEKAQRDGKKYGRHWAVAKKQKGRHGFTVALDGDTFLRILARALEA